MPKDSYVVLSNYIDLLLDAICVVDKDGHFEFVSAGAERIFGYTPQEMLGRQMLDFVHPDDRIRTLQTAGEINAGAMKFDFENRYLRKDGKIVNLLWSARWSANEQRRVAVARDITKNKQAEARQAALYAISEAAYAAEDLLALYQRIHKIIASLMPAEQLAFALCDEAQQVSFPYNSFTTNPDSVKLSALCNEVARRGETLTVTPDNQSERPPALQKLVGVHAMNWLGVPLKSHHAVIGVMTLQQSDLQRPYTSEEIEVLEFVSTQVALAIERKQLIAKLQTLALHDQLTGLPNRQLFSDRLHSALARVKREATNIAILYLDLDKFKQINDALGHSAGDDLLRQTAQRILGCLRQTDTVARFGGDEFVVLLQHIAVPEDAMQHAEKIRQAFLAPFLLAGQSIDVFPSIGVALCPQQGMNAEQLVHLADAAMYQVKHSGGNAIRLAETSD